ncbi:zinc finger protein 496 [Fukomys damarensis]|uniref:zinc finger protein 496 n=1 Tax=Fukomys damarensis TaxID=885580 RepID=UPI0008FF5B07|nr:zinc finger protein 496 [Fukomys damarensis]
MALGLSRPPGQLCEGPAPQDACLLEEDSVGDAQQVATFPLPPTRASPFKDMILCFSEEDWSLLDPAQTGFYGEFIIGEDCGVSVSPDDPEAQPALSPSEDSEPRVPELPELQGREAPQAPYSSDFPGLQPFPVEERSRWEELQVPEFQACQAPVLAQSTCPATPSPAPLEDGLEEEVTIEIVLSGSGDEEERGTGARGAQAKAYVCPDAKDPADAKDSGDRDRPGARRREPPQDHALRCRYCAKSFGQNCGLLRHERLHMKRRSKQALNSY